MPGHGAGLQRGSGTPPEHPDDAHRGDALTEALDALEAGDVVGAPESFEGTWLETYGIDVDAEVTDVVGAFALT